MSLLPKLSYGNNNGRQYFFVWMQTSNNVVNTMPTKDIGWIMPETDLLDLHHLKYPYVPQPATHI